MELSGKVYVGDVGTLIRIDMQEPLDDLEDISLHVKKPDGTVVTWGAVPVPTPSEAWEETVVQKDGNYLEYIIQEGDVDISGDYLVQPQGTIKDWTGSGYTTQFTVYELFK